MSHGEIPHFSSIWGYLWIPRPQNGLGMTRNCIFSQPVKPGRTRIGGGRETGAPIKGPDQKHRDAKGAHRGAENAQPFEAPFVPQGKQGKQAAAIREREGAAEAGPYTHQKTGAAPIKRFGVQKTHKQRPYNGPGPTYDIGEKKLCRNRKKRIHGAGINLFVCMEAWERRCVLI
jgi:hypothetical protein